MRKSFEVQLALGAVPIEKVEISTKTRDELPPTLCALQWIFTNPEVNKEVFELLEKEITPSRKATGRPGMDLWQILVLGVVRLTLDVNYDRLHYVSNYDSLTRQLLGQPVFDMTLEFKLSTIKENIPLLIATDQYSLIHDYKIMSGGDEASEVIPLVNRLLDKYGQGSIASISNDKGFSKMTNWEPLEKLIPIVVIPKKGKHSKADKERQGNKQWKTQANKHSAIESNINCLEHHGLNRCPGKGYQGCRRYTGLGVLAYNLHKIGNYLLESQRKAEKKDRRLAS